MDLLEHFIFISDNVGATSAFVFFDPKGEPKIESLSEKELKIYSKFTSRKRQQEFIAGRIACKKAFFKLTRGEKDYFEKFSSVSVLNNKTGAPFIENSDLFVTLSHSHEVAVAVICDHPIGVDIERINPRKISALKKMSSEIEPNFQNITSLTVLWTLKESLGKALQTGIVKDFRYYDTKNFRLDNGLYRCDFKNFPSFSGTATTNKNFSIALVYPR